MASILLKKFDNIRFIKGASLVIAGAIITIAVFFGWISLMFPASTYITFNNDKERAEYVLSNTEKNQIETILQKSYCAWPLERCEIKLATPRKAKNPNNNYSQIINGYIIFSTPWIFRENPVAGDKFGFILTKSNTDNFWQLAQKTCCCMTCAEYY